MELRSLQNAVLEDSIDQLQALHCRYFSKAHSEMR